MRFFNVTTTRNNNKSAGVLARSSTTPPFVITLKARTKRPPRLTQDVLPVPRPRNRCRSWWAPSSGPRCAPAGSAAGCWCCAGRRAAAPEDRGGGAAGSRWREGAASRGGAPAPAGGSGSPAAGGRRGSGPTCCSRSRRRGAPATGRLCTTIWLEEIRVVGWGGGVGRRVSGGDMVQLAGWFDGQCLAFWWLWRVILI